MTADISRHQQVRPKKELGEAIEQGAPMRWSSSTLNHLSAKRLATHLADPRVLFLVKRAGQFSGCHRADLELLALEVVPVLRLGRVR